MSFNKAMIPMSARSTRSSDNSAGLKRVFEARPRDDLRVALLTTFFPFFEGVFPDEYRQRQEANSLALARDLEYAGLSVMCPGLTDSEACAEQQVALMRTWEPDVLVVAPLMACPSTFALPVALALDVPIVVCQVLRTAEFVQDYDEVTATEDSTLLGAAMLQAGLLQHDMRFVSVTHRVSDPVSALVPTIRGAIAGSSLQQRLIGVIGSVLDGYVDVQVRPEDLARFNAAVVPIDSQTLVETFMKFEAHDAAIDKPRQFTVSDLGAGNQGLDVRVDPQELSADLCLGAALESLAQSAGVDALVLNCHDSAFRRSEAVGIPACLAASRLASGDCPVTCTGDVSTAVALLLVREFTSEVSYCEPFTVAYDTGEVLVASCGIGNISTSSDNPLPQVRGNFAYPGVRGPGARLTFAFKPGPVTMCAFVPSTTRAPAHVIWTTGISLGRFLPEMHGPHGVLRLTSADPIRCMERWASHGPAHHVALAAADLSVEFRTMTTLEALPLVEIT